MPAITSAGILLYRVGPTGLEVLLGHMGGPFWARKDHHAWSIPKGEHDHTESPLQAARREFSEEIGAPPPGGTPIDLGTIRQSRKTVAAFALDGTDFIAAAAVAERPDDSSWVELEWPPRSGKTVRFPELDRAEWFDLQTARAKIVKGQAPFLDRLADVLED